ncbi:hypothetical protein SAICODRAFT_60911 [Saitoella complicata NRRL Y-17804]|nr:uncharacterized protein SAICODRAFT_60911 [Saitoella complicata NRRL Y-17804]ODQ50845.1 hypothetical protein SAICODRAFT_60911 [Saitoella complicata NRRL Y-17804]
MPPQRNQKKHSAAGPREVTAPNSASTSRLKKKIRDIERLLKKDSLPATARVQNERALDALSHELQVAQKASKESTLISKYHMVRFFERQKASRKMKQAEKRLASASEAEASTLKEQLHNHKIDYYYAIHFPLDEKYVSLYPKEGADNSTAVAKRKEMRAWIEKEMLAGKLGQYNARTKLGQQQAQAQARPSGSNRAEVGQRKQTSEKQSKGKGAIKAESVQDDFFEAAPAKKAKKDDSSSESSEEESSSKESGESESDSDSE